MARMTSSGIEQQIKIRLQTVEDRGEVWAVNLLAFDRPQEAELVEALQQRDAVLCSLVAELENKVVGHILFSPATIKSNESKLTIAALGPMAVLPGFQNQGIGSRLVRAGLNYVRGLGYNLVIVLGHSAYYPRFGFKPAQSFGIHWEHDAPSEAFMVAELVPGALDGVRGTVYYQPEFGLI
jgi:putative acetyltransferase